MATSRRHENLGAAYYATVRNEIMNGFRHDMKEETVEALGKLLFKDMRKADHHDMLREECAAHGIVVEEQRLLYSTVMRALRDKY